MGLLDLAFVRLVGAPVANVARISSGVRAAASAGRERKVVAASSEISSAGRRMIVLLVKDLGVCPTPICPRYRSGQSTSFTGFPASRFPSNGLEAGAAGATVAGHSHGCDRVKAGRPSPSWLAEGRRAQGNGQGCRVPVPKSPTRDRNAVTAAIFWLKTRAKWKQTSLSEITGKDCEPSNQRRDFHKQNQSTIQWPASPKRGRHRPLTVIF